MGDLSPHFSRYEFECRCKQCGLDTVDSETLAFLEQIRTYFDSKITIHSGCRCVEYNKKVGGSLNSQHPKCRAVDFHVDGYSSEVVHAYCETIMPNRGGLGLYDNFVHLDTRTGCARWGD